MRRGGLGYEVTRQTGCHLRLTTVEPAEYHVMRHHALGVGTLSAILRDVAEHHGMSKDERIERLF